jgi:hypothetical protein
LDAFTLSGVEPKLAAQSASAAKLTIIGYLRLRSNDAFWLKLDGTSAKVYLRV